MTMTVAVVGGGLAGCEAAYALAQRGVSVRLHEMRPTTGTPAHQTSDLAELVCSNSFKSTDVSNAHGLLKAEMRCLGSIVLDAADASRVPGGAALVVDRHEFARHVEATVRQHPLIQVECVETTTLPSPGIVATGPLTSDGLASTIQEYFGVTALAFFDAIAPIVSSDSLDSSILFRASRYGKGETEADAQAYLNAPMTAAEYHAFVDAMVAADQYPGHDFDQAPYFEGCLPVEEMARRGVDTLRFGPMKPVGLRDPRSRAAPHAVVQLRQEDRAAQMWNLVGFQTQMRHREQKRIFRMIPGLQGAEFLRWGSIHRNSYINSPAVLTRALHTRRDDQLFFAGQLTGVEGYTESAATGILAGINLARTLGGEKPAVPPPTTMLGALLRYLVEADPDKFQPMNANFGLLEPLSNRIRDKAKRRVALAQRALGDMRAFVEQLGQPVPA